MRLHGLGWALLLLPLAQWLLAGGVFLAPHARYVRLCTPWAVALQRLSPLTLCVLLCGTLTQLLWAASAHGLGLPLLVGGWVRRPDEATDIAVTTTAENRYPVTLRGVFTLVWELRDAFERWLLILFRRRLHRPDDRHPWLTRAQVAAAFDLHATQVERWEREVRHHSWHVLSNRFRRDLHSALPTPALSRTILKVWVPAFWLGAWDVCERLIQLGVDDATVWDILLYAACTELDTASGNTVREQLTAALDATPSGLLDLEHQLNDLLRAQLPQRLRGYFPTQRYDIAIDLVEIPYHGQSQCDPKEVRRSKAKAGTTHFHVYATLALVQAQERYELALTFVLAGESLVTVVERLMVRAHALGLRIRCAYLDKGFSSSAIFRYLRRHRIPYLIPVPLRGKALKALCRGTLGRRVRYTFKAGTAEAYTTELVLVRQYRAGRHGKHGVDHLAQSGLAVSLGEFSVVAF